VKHHTVAVYMAVRAAVPTGAVALALVVVAIGAVYIADMGLVVLASCIPLQRTIIYSQFAVIRSITHPMMVSNSLVFDHLSGYHLRIRCTFDVLGSKALMDSFYRQS
jgi:hypothetical protein